MKATEYSQLVQDTWAAHATFRKLGFLSDNIYVLIAGNGKQPESGLWVFVKLCAQDKEFLIDIAPLDVADTVFVQVWSDFVTHFNAHDFDEHELHIIFERFLTRAGGSLGLVQAMMDKGFYFPRNMS